MTSPQCLSILLLTEDSSAGSHDTLRALTKKMILLLDPACQTHLIELRPSPERAERAMHGNRWQSRNPRDHFKLIDLGDTIATKLLERDGFVFFHFDGDRTWAERSTSDNATKFQAFVQSYIEPRVDAHLRKRDALAEKEARMARLRPLVPYYSIEAWIY